MLATGEQLTHRLAPPAVGPCLVGLDINPEGLALAFCALLLASPASRPQDIACWVMPHGRQPDGSVRAGSIELLEVLLAGPALLPFDSSPPAGGLLATLGGYPRATGLVSDPSGDIPSPGPSEWAHRFDLVMLNPPYTRGTLRHHQYDPAERQAVHHREQVLAQNLLAHGWIDEYQAVSGYSLSTFFTVLGRHLLAYPGVLVQIMPTTALLNRAGSNQRQYLAQAMQVKIVLTSHDPRQVAFSNNTHIHESVVLAWARPRGPATASQKQEENPPVRFISLRKMPQTPQEAEQLALHIHAGDTLPARWGCEHRWSYAKVSRGDFSPVQVYDPELLASYQACLARLQPDRCCPLSELATVGPAAARMRDAFVWQAMDKTVEVGDSLPVVWHHPSDLCTTLALAPDGFAVPKPHRRQYAHTLYRYASRLVLANRFNATAVRCTAGLLPTPGLGAGWTPVQLQNIQETQETTLAQQKALCVWCNSTLGVLGWALARSQSLSYSRYALHALRALPVLRLSEVALAPLVQAFDALQQKPLARWQAMATCPVRSALDQAVVQALDHPACTLEHITDMAWRLSREPTITGQRPPLS